ncbi:MAG: CIA30 family protein [Pseudomonadota bacterium]
MKAAGVMAIMATQALGSELLVPEEMGGWGYVEDGVMGGVSNGRAAYVDGALRMVGSVSTDNNGGFIQVRTRTPGDWPADAQGLELQVRGNGEVYYVFLKTPELRRVFHSFRAPFETGADWATVRVAFADFTPSHSGMPEGFTPDQVSSLALVAYGRDHEADLSVRSIRLY